MVGFLTGLVLVIFQGAVPRPSASHFQHCQSSHRPSLSSLHQADISLNINDSFVCVAVIYQAQRFTKAFLYH